jgi:CDP-diglyceride synthetase
LLLKKIVYGLLIGFSVILAEWFSPFIWFLAVCAIAIYGNYELQKIIEEKKYRHSYKLITTFIILFLGTTYITANLPVINENLIEDIRTLIFPYTNDISIMDFKAHVTNNVISVQNFLLGIAFLLLIIVNLNYTPRVSIGEVSFALIRIIYLGFFPSYIILLRALPKGAEFLLLILCGSVACDVLAYVCGKNFGKHHLLPEISPNKTVEGAIGGTLACVILCTIGGTLLIGIPWYHALLIGIMTAIISQMGDLIESLFKRDVGKKDSGDLIPGHGGVLDRVDSYIFISFPVYFYILWAVY